MKEPKPNQYVIVQAKALKALAKKYVEGEAARSVPLFDEMKKQTVALERIATAAEKMATGLVWEAVKP